MRSVPWWTCGRLLAVVMAIALPATGAALAVSLDESRPGVWGICVDPDGNPVPGVKVTVKPKGTAAGELSVTSSKKGRFVFPRLDLYKDGYEVKVEKEGWFVREYHFRTRRGTREIWQDDSGKLSPSQQVFPPLRYRGIGTNGTIHLVMMKIEDFREERKAPSDQAAPGKKAPAAEPAPVAPPTPEEQARAAAALGDWQTAVARYKEALAERSADVDLRWEYARALARAGDSGAALREAMKVQRAEPQKPGVNLAIARWLVDEGQTEAAIPYLEKERALDPENPKLLAQLYDAYVEAGRKEDARKLLDAWVAAAPEDPEALMALAMARADEGDLDGAEELFRKVAEMNPQEADRMFYNVGATIMNRSGLTEADRRRAVAAFERALEVNPSFAPAHLELAYALIGLGKRKEALEHFRKFVELAPDDPRAGEARGMIDALGSSS